MTNLNPLTGVISSAKDALDMLWWCVDIFEHSLNDSDGDGSRQGFAVIAFAQASATLHAWVCAELANNGDSTVADSDLFHRLADEILWTREFRAIAEATRHAKMTSKYWNGRNVPILRGETDHLDSLDPREGDDYVIALFKGLGDGSLWFENALQNGEQTIDAKFAIVQHAQQWQNKLPELGLT